MSQSSALASAEPRNPFRPGTPGPLSKLVYRSRAVKKLSPPELHDLTAVAQARNGRESITGVMLYDDDRFFQWLEGPNDSVDRIMGSIRNDRRHTDIEVLDSQPTQSRAFADWTMKLATPGPVLASWRRDVIDPPRDVVEDLRKRPDAAPSLLVKLVAAPPQASDTAASDAVARMPLNRAMAAILKNVFLSAVVPQLGGAGQGPRAPDLPPANPRAAELADLLVATDQEAAIELIRELQGEGAPIQPLYATLFEPAARSLGDLWSEDVCSEFDVTLGLCRLQTAARLLGADSRRAAPSRLPQPIVLIAPEPGELHRLGAALDGSVLEKAGWSPQCAFPTDDQALDDLLASTWFDVLDLSLSTAFRRDNLLPRLKETIAQARRASRNPALVVVVGGRVFKEEKSAGLAVGADHANTTALNVNRSILHTMSTTGTVTASETSEVTATAS